VPPTPPPTSGPSGTKHARDDTIDVDETPVKKSKGKSKSKAENVAVVDAEEPEVGDLGELEEPAGDDDWYDPEGDALGEYDEEGAEDEDEDVEAERADEDETALVAPQGPRVEKKAGSRRKRISVPRSVQGFIHVSIRGARKLPTLSDADRMKCRQEYARRMKKIIHQRSLLAHSEEATDASFPMSYGMRQWWLSQREQEIYEIVHTATSKPRRLVLGGIWLHFFEYTDLPPMTDEELAMWAVYGDLVDGKEMYVGSATRDPSLRASFARFAEYEKAKQRADRDIDVSPETDKSKHLRAGLRKGAVMELRVLAVFDPLAVKRVVAMAVEAIYVDFLQSFDRDWVYQQTYESGYVYSSPQCLELSKAASNNDARWSGLNLAHPLKQGAGDNMLRRRVTAQKSICEICMRHLPDAEWRLSSHIPSSILLCKNWYVCRRCHSTCTNNPDLSLAQVREFRTESNSLNAVNLKYFTQTGMTMSQLDDRLEEQGCKCPACHTKGLARHELPEGETISNYWTVVPSKWQQHLGEAYWMCMNCNRALSDLEPDQIADFLQHLRKASTAKAKILAIDPTASGTSLGMMARAWATHEQKFTIARKQGNCCAACFESKWEHVDSPVDLYREDSANIFLDEWPESSDPVVLCNTCASWFKKIRDNPTPEIIRLIADRRARQADRWGHLGIIEGKRMRERHEKFLIVQKQNFECPVCLRPWWKGVTGAEDMPTKGDDTETRPLDWNGEQAVVCKACQTFVGKHQKTSEWSARLQQRRDDFAGQ